MLDKKVVELLNQQVNKEFYSAYLYLDFSNFCYDQGLDGFGNWYRVQAQEERDHAMLLYSICRTTGKGRFWKPSRNRPLRRTASRWCLQRA